MGDSTFTISFTILNLSTRSIDWSGFPTDETSFWCHFFVIHILEPKMGHQIETATAIDEDDDVVDDQMTKLIQRAEIWGCVAAWCFGGQLIAFFLFRNWCWSSVCPDGLVQSEAYKCTNDPLEVPHAPIFFLFWFNWCGKNDDWAVKMYRCDPLLTTSVQEPTCINIQVAIHIAFAALVYVVPCALFSAHYLSIVLNRHKS